MEPWWNPRGTLPQGRPGPPRSLSGLRPQSFQLLGKNEKRRITKKTQCQRCKALTAARFPICSHFFLKLVLIVSQLCPRPFFPTLSKAFSNFSPTCSQLVPNLCSQLFPTFPNLFPTCVHNVSQFVPTRKRGRSMPASMDQCPDDEPNSGQFLSSGRTLNLLAPSSRTACSLEEFILHRKRPHFKRPEWSFKDKPKRSNNSTRNHQPNTNTKPTQHTTHKHQTPTQNKQQRTNTTRTNKPTEHHPSTHQNKPTKRVFSLRFFPPARLGGVTLLRFQQLLKPLLVALRPQLLLGSRAQIAF